MCCCHRVSTQLRLNIYHIITTVPRTLFIVTLYVDFPSVPIASRHVFCRQSYRTCTSKGAHTRTSLALESASGSLTRDPGSDIYTCIIGQSPARDIPHTDEFDSLEPEPSRTRWPDSYVYGHLNPYPTNVMERLVKPEILTSYIYGPIFGNAESHLFLFAAQCFNTKSMLKVILWHSCV
jgi:hypothetical protein